MSASANGGETPPDPGAAAAERFVFDALRGEFERREAAEAALYLKHLIKAVPQPPQAGPGYRRVRLRLHQRVSDYAAEYSVDSGDRSMWSFSLLGEDSSEGIDRQKALEIATKAAQPPADAVLESAEYEVQGDASVFSARWVHVHQGMPVENDFIMVLVNGATGRPFVLHRCWHTVDEKPSWR